MITYVNTVLVSNQNGDSLCAKADLEGKSTAAAAKALAGQFAVMNCDPNASDVYTIDANTDTFKIGVVTDKYTTIVNESTGALVYVPVVKWSNEIKVTDIKSLTKLTYTEDKQEEVVVDFTQMDSNTQALVAQGNINIIFRIQYKDIPARYRKWTESYNYVTKIGDDATAIANAFAATINKQSKRARVIATASSGILSLVAMEYDDDLADDTENPAATVRFNVNTYFTNPAAPGWASNNKYELLPAAAFEKRPGVIYPASAKLVREHERNAHGYLGAIHTCEWYDPKPAMIAKVDGQYGGFTLEFENMYRAADDIFRKTKQTVEVYAMDGDSAMAPATIGSGLLAKIEAAMAKSNVRASNTAIDNSAAYDPENFGHTA